MSPVNTKITRYGYIIRKAWLSLKQLAEIKRDLTVTPSKYGAFQRMGAQVKWHVYEENGDYISVPKYYGLAKFGEPDINRIEDASPKRLRMRYLGLLRPRQEVIMEKMIDAFNTKRGGVVIAGCGSGKTNLAIYSACHLKVKALFVVHKEFLRDQARDRILSTTNIRRVGLVQGKIVDTEHPIVIGMVQTLIKRDYDSDFFKQFGMVIIDEVHHMGARNFSKLYKMISAKYMLGITAEHSRADGLFKIINWYMGPVIHREEQLPNSMVVVKRFHYKSLDGDNTKMHYIRGTGMKEPDRSKMITNLTMIKKRTRFIFRIIISLFDMGKNILFLTGRLDHVNRLFEMLESEETIRGSVGMYTGEMVQKDRDKSATKQIILATYEMAQEGLDIESLNAVILGTPKGAVKQAVGRILRKEVYEEHPMVIDIIDAIEIFEKQAARRESYFETQEYQIQDLWVTEDSEDTKSISWRDSEAIEKSLREMPKAREKLVKPEPKRTRVKCIVESDDEYD